MVPTVQFQAPVMNGVVALRAAPLVRIVPSLGCVIEIGNAPVRGEMLVPWSNVAGIQHWNAPLDLDPEGAKLHDLRAIMAPPVPLHDPNPPIGDGPIKPPPLRSDANGQLPGESAADFIARKKAEKRGAARAAAMNEPDAHD